MDTADHIIVGSGINALVAAAMLGRNGHKVLVLERNERIGGCIRSEEITAPGFVHDVMATTFVLFITSPAYAALAADLGKHGLEFAHSATPTGVLMPDGRSVVFRMDRAANIATFETLAEGRRGCLRARHRPHGWRPAIDLRAARRRRCGRDQR